MEAHGLQAFVPGVRCLHKNLLAFFAYPRSRSGGAQFAQQLFVGKVHNYSLLAPFAPLLPLFVARELPPPPCPS